MIVKCFGLGKWGCLSILIGLCVMVLPKRKNWTHVLLSAGRGIFPVYERETNDDALAAALGGCASNTGA